MREDISIKIAVRFEGNGSVTINKSLLSIDLDELPVLVKGEDTDKYLHHKDDRAFHQMVSDFIKDLLGIRIYPYEIARAAMAADKNRGE